MVKPSLKDSSTPPPPRRPSRWRRRLAIVAIVVGALLILAIATVQVVLWTDIPRDLVAGQLERQLGVQVELAKVSTGWDGRTTLEDLQLRFPLADEPFAVIPRLDVTHAGLIKILLGRPLAIEQASAERAALVLREERGGGWNIQRLGRRRPGAPQPPPSAEQAARPLQIPNLRIDNATVAIIDQQGRRTVVQGLSIDGSNQGANAYDIDASLPGRVELSCALNLRTLEHQVALQAQGLDAAIKPLIPQWPDPVIIHAQWDGRVDEKGVSGRLELQSLRVAGNAFRGGMRVRADRDGVVVWPRDVQVSGVAAMTDLRLIGGAVRIADGAIAFEQLRVASGQGMAQVDGQWHPADASADVKAVWSKLAVPAGAVHSGGMRLGLARRLDGRQALTVELDNTGTAAGGKWDAKLHLEAVGTSWSAMQWTLAAEKLDVGMGQIELDLDGLEAVAEVDEGRLTLREMSMQQAGLLEGQGAFELGGEREWWLYIHGRRLPVPAYRELDAQAMISAWGNGSDIRLQQVYARVGDLQISGDGYYSRDWETPLVLQVSAYHPSPTGLSTADAPPLEGGVDAEFSITGQVEPVNLRFTGGVRGRDLRFRHRDVGQINLAVTGTIRPDLVAFETTEADLLGGRWRFWGRLAQAQQSQVLGVHVQGLPLAHAGQILEVDGLSGVFGGDWRITLPQGQQGTRVEGQFEIADLSYTPPVEQELPRQVIAPGDLPTLEEHLAQQDAAPAVAQTRLPIFQASHVSGRTVIADQRLRLEDLLLRQEDGTLRGSASIGLRQRRHLDVKLTLDRWPARLPGSPGSLRLSGSSDVVIDLLHREIAGPVELISDLLLARREVGQFSFNGRFSGRGIDLPNIRADVFGGRAWGRATFDIDRPLRSTGTLQFNDLRAAEMVALWPRLEGLTGSFRGMAHLRPAQPRTRPVGPLRLSGYIEPVEPAHFRAAELRSAAFDLFIDTRSATAVDGVPGGLRIVLDNARLEAFGGVFDLWARYTRHPGGEVSSQSNISFSGVSLDQVMRTVDPEDDKPTPGVLDGAATIVGNPFDRERAFGEGTVHLADSDLASIESIALLYDLMNIGTDTAQPTGEGTLSLRLEAQTLMLMEMSYFNRGTELRAVGQFDRIWDLPHTPVQATIVGIGRPFRDLELPFMPDVDDILAAVQRNATTVRVGGTVAKPDVRQATFEEIGQTLRSVLLGEAVRE